LYVFFAITVLLHDPYYQVGPIQGGRIKMIPFRLTSGVGFLAIGAWTIAEHFRGACAGGGFLEHSPWRRGEWRKYASRP